MKIKVFITAALVIWAMGANSNATAQLNSAASTLQETRYNRVEGFHLGGHYGLGKYVDGRLRPEAFLGYGLASKEATYGLRMRYQYGRSAASKITASVFHDVLTFDTALMGLLENTTASFFMKEDFYDYFLADGFNASFRYPIGKRHDVSVMAHNIEYGTMALEAEWALANWFSDKTFRCNPAVQAGVEHRLTLGYVYDSRINKFFPMNDISVSLQLEQSGHGIGGDFEFYGVRVDAKKYQRTFGAQKVIFRGFVGIRDAVVGDQFLYDLGGIGTLRGYDQKEYTGNRALMANIDYFFNRSILNRLPLNFIPLYSAMSLIAFADIGWTNRIGDMKLNSDNIRENVGIGLSIAHEFLRINFALPNRPVGENGIRVTMRVFQRL